MITQELVKELFDYRDGALYRKTAKTERQVSEAVGTVNGMGYLVVSIKSKLYRVHRLIYLYHHGYLPALVDHANNNQLDNRIENLRPATKSQNAQNSKRRVTNISGIKGVGWDKSRKQWKVDIKIHTGKKHWGRFDDLELAKLVAIEVRNKYHKEFTRHE
jgi:hypothetical protein